MKNKTWKKIGLFMLLLVCFFGGTFRINAQDVDDIQIIPELEGDDLTKVQEAVEEIGQSGGHVMETYNKKAGTLTTEQQLASGIMNWDTIVNYLVYVIKFLSQLGIVIGVVFIMYAGYRYMISIFNGFKTPSTTIKNAIIGVIIVIFSYAIMKILTSLVGLS